jgi:hypothetical protein
LENVENILFSALGTFMLQAVDRKKYGAINDSLSG